MAAANMCTQNCTDSGAFLHEILAEESWAPWNIATDYFGYSPWFFSLIGSTLIGLAGIFPLLVIRIEEGADLKTGAGAGTLKTLLSFAVGGLLGDVFLHLLPESWENESFRNDTDAGHASVTCGLWVLSGFLVFIIVEKIFTFESETETEDPNASTISKDSNTREVSSNQVEKEMENNNCIRFGEKSKYGYTKRYAKTEFSKTLNNEQLKPFLERKPAKYGYSLPSNGYKDTHNNVFVNNGGMKPVLMCKKFSNDALKGLSSNERKDCLKKLMETNGLSAKVSTPNGCNQKLVVGTDASSNKTATKEKSKHITGYLNLMANVIDNFTHGLAVGGSFLVSFRLGALTTFAILIHEIPHEVGDFAILLRSGFNRWDAARAQLITASGGIFGAMSAVCFSGNGVEGRTSWILPFTAGGFLHIGMVTILPELNKETSPKESLKHLVALLIGIMVMAILTIFCD